MGLTALATVIFNYKYLVLSRTGYAWQMSRKKIGRKDSMGSEEQNRGQFVGM